MLSIRRSFRCRREAEIHYAMREAPNIVSVLAFSVDDPQRLPCLVMELMDESLYDYLGVRDCKGISGSLSLLVECLKLINGICRVRGKNVYARCWATAVSSAVYILQFFSR